MQKENARVGMKVYFGRGNGEKTLGEIVKLNPTKAKVKTLEERGRSDRHYIGQVWTVPYSLMGPASGEASAMQAAPVVREPLKFSPFSNENLLLEALLKVYVNLSPENLTGDGEAPRAWVQKQLTVLQRQLKGLTIALGREVSESEVHEWYQSKQEYMQRNPGVVKA